MTSIHYDQKFFKTQVLLIGAIILTFVGGFWSSLVQLTIRWDSGDNSYGYLIVPVFIYLCWEQRKTFRFEEFTAQPMAIFLVFVSLSLMFLGEYGSVETLIYIGLWASITSIFIYLYGFRSRYLFLNFIVLMFIIPLPPYVNNILTFKMKMISSTISVELLRLSGVKVFLEGNVIDLGVSKLQVVDACSGLRYVMPMLLMAILIGHFSTDRFWKKLVLIMLVMPLSIFINGFRIYLTGILTKFGYAELAENLFHDFTGLVIFLLASALLIGTAWFFKKVNVRTERSNRVKPNNKGNVTSRVNFIACTLLISLLIIATSFILKGYAKALVVPDRVTFEGFPTEVGGWQGTKIVLSKEILDALWADDYVNIDYTTPGKSNHIFLLIPYYEYQKTRHTAHAPEACLLGGGWATVDSQKSSIEVEQGKIIPVMKSVFQKGDQKLISLYFFLQRGTVITSPWMNKLHLMIGALSERRTDGALIRIEMTVNPGQKLEKEEIYLQDFFRNLWPLLSEYIPD